MNLPARLGARGLFGGSRRTFGGTDLEPMQRDVSSATGDEFRLIKRQIVSRTAGDTGTGRDPRIIVVTSALPGEGKTFVALHLAMSLALEKAVAVTLVDCNVDDSQSARFSDRADYGLLDYLQNPTSGVERALVNSSIPNVKILPRGRVRDDAPELVGGDAMSNLLNGLVSKSNNGFVVVDTGAILAGGTAVALAQHAGQIVFVIEKDRTRRAEVEESLGLLDRVGGPINEHWVGFVFNKAEPSESLARHRA